MSFTVSHSFFLKFIFIFSLIFFIVSPLSEACLTRPEVEFTIPSIPPLEKGMPFEVLVNVTVKYGFGSLFPFEVEFRVKDVPDWLDAQVTKDIILVDGNFSGGESHGKTSLVLNARELHTAYALTSFMLSANATPYIIPGIPFFPKGYGEEKIMVEQDFYDKGVRVETVPILKMKKGEIWYGKLNITNYCNDDIAVDIKLNCSLDDFNVIFEENSVIIPSGFYRSNKKSLDMMIEAIGGHDTWENATIHIIYSPRGNPAWGKSELHETFLLKATENGIVNPYVINYAFYFSIGLIILVLFFVLFKKVLKANNY